MIEALAAAVEVRDQCTGEHLQRVTALAQKCLEEAEPSLAMSPDVRYGFMLHDVGKIGVPDAILNKPGPLDRTEWSVMQRHPQIGVDIVGPVGLSDRATQIILCHHERWNGSGYPNGLSKDEIPLTARAFAVADAYDAMTSDRPYRNAMSRGDALQIIKASAGRTFDPDMVDVLVGVAMTEDGAGDFDETIIDLT
jgi:putative two-component system response regulator